jgi:exosome complex RNA-binding protein Csl4
MLSCIFEGRVLDFKYKKLSEFAYTFRIGDIYVGQVFNMGDSWSAVSATPNPYGVVDGFKNRYYASEYLLKVGGYRPK